MKKSTKNLMLLFILFIGLNIAHATTYYVATNGNNSYTNAQAQNIATPWKTITYGVGKLVTGDILYVMTGTYAEAVYIGQSGITLSAYPGNSPVIDGQTVPGQNWQKLIFVVGNNNTISGFEVKNCNISGGGYLGGHGIQVNGFYNTISKINAHHNWGSGLRIVGNYTIVEDCSVWQNLRENSINPGSSIWGSALSAAGTGGGISAYNILRRNTVFNNWGEGVNCWQSNQCTVEDNIVYDNWTNNLYLSDATNCLVQRNIVYISSAPAITFKDSRPSGITLADEVSSYPRSANNTVINNFIYNTDLYAFAWTIVTNSGLNNVLIANNTIVNGRLATGSSGSIVNTNSQIRNNIIGTGSSVPGKSGLTFSNNCWSATPPANAAGTGDVIGNPQVAQTGSTAPGALTVGFFKLLATSPAINKAMVLTQVTQDFFKTIRGSSPDIGGHEFTTILPTQNSSFCNSTLAPIIDGVAESTWTQIKTDTLKNIISGTVTSSADLSTTYKAIWDNTALYLLVRVKDDVLKNDSGINTWDDDALEIFVDGNNNKATSYDANDHQYIIRINDATVYEYGTINTQNPAGVTFSQGVYAGGYLMEIKITWSAIGVTPASGKFIGLDILTDDDDDGGTVDASMSWFTQTTSSSSNPSTFGTIKLDNTSCGNITTGIVIEKTDNATLIYPNPFNTNFTLKFSDETILQNAFMKIFDVCGKEVKIISINNNETIIDKSELQSGIYFYSIINNNEKIATGKLIAQQ